MKNIWKMTVSDRTKAFFKSIDDTDTSSGSGGAGASSSLDTLLRIDEGWQNLKNFGWKTPPQQIVLNDNKNEILSKTVIDEGKYFDITVCGGTLGVFYAMVMQLKGWKTCVIERAKVLGREQEWNISKKELDALIRSGILTKDEVDSLISIEFNPVRVGFHSSSAYDSSKPQDGFELFTRDILNVGVKPSDLINLVKEKYIAAGGAVIEQTGLSRIDIYKNTALITAGPNKYYSRLVIDAMGNASPIVKQIRGAVEPDGICIVVGSCARGFDPANNTYGDVIYTNSQVQSKPTTSLAASQSPAKSQLQYFWEAFPAGSDPADRTTYLFTYIDAKPERPSVAEVITSILYSDQYYSKTISAFRSLMIIGICFHCIKE
jgi:hypothetical protein